MSDCNNLYILSTIACQLANCMSEEELVALSANLVVLGDMIVSIIAQNNRCKNLTSQP